MIEKTIGVTNGVFDILHPGHVNLFREIKKECGYLVVFINSDSSARLFKRETINNVQSRSEVLLSIKYIDKLFVFDEETPETIFNNVLWKYKNSGYRIILYKGSEYKTGKIVTSKYIDKIKLVKNNGMSTTKIIERIVNGCL